MDAPLVKNFSGSLSTSFDADEFSNNQLPVALLSQNDDDNEMFSDTEPGQNDDVYYERAYMMVRKLLKGPNGEAIHVNLNAAKATPTHATATMEQNSQQPESQPQLMSRIDQQVIEE
jgi:hypothetical protein